MHPEFRYQYDDMTAESVAFSLGKTVAKVLRTRYGPTPDPAIIKRVQEEWSAMEAAGDIGDVAAPLLLPPVPWRKLDIRPAGR